MPRGDPNAGQKIGLNSRFNSETAAEASKKSRASARANSVVRKCLKGIATQALYGKPPIDDAQLRPVAKFFKIPINSVTFAHLAIFKQSVEMAKGDAGALNLVAAYAGEKPSEKVEVISADMSALDEAFGRETRDGT